MADLAPLVLLPGLLCDARLWREQALALHDVADIQVADLTLDDSVAAMAARVLAAAPERFALGGLSMGGYVAFEILRQAPERVTRLALFSTSAAPDSPQRAEQRRRAMAALSVGRFLGVTQQMMPQLLPPSRLNDPLAGEVKAMAGRVGGEAFLRQQRAILGRPDSRPDLAGVRVPTLVAVGDLDRLTPPAEAQAIHEGIAGSTLHVFADCGHLPAMERPDEATGLLRAWLAEGSAL